MTQLNNIANWNVEISGITCSLDQEQKVLAQGELAYQTVAEQAEALTKTAAFQKTLAQLPKEAQCLHIEVTGTSFQIFDARHHLLFDSNASTNPEPSTYQEAVGKINHIATKALRPSTPHPISNEGLYCFANSAYQLLANIPSLKTSVLEQLPAHFAALKNYSKISSGKELVETWNRLAKPQEQFTVDRGHMASEFLERVISQCSPSFLPTLTTTSTRKNPKKEQKITTHSAPSAFVGLQTTATGTSLDFKVALEQGLSTTRNPTEVQDEEVLSSTSYFTNSPKQLFLKVDRFKKDQKDARPLKHIPHLLDTTPLIGKDAAATTLELKGFLVQRGDGLGKGGGHYVAYIKTEDATQPGRYEWVCADDASIQAVSEDQLNKELEQASDLYYDNMLTNISKSVVMQAAAQEK